ICHPAKSVKLAPSWVWTSTSGLVRSGTGSDTSSPGVAGATVADAAAAREVPWELPLCHEPESFTRPIEKGGFHRRRNQVRFTFQSGQFDAVHRPERLAGRLAPSVPGLTRLSRIACAARYSICAQPTVTSGTPLKTFSSSSSQDDTKMEPS